MSKKRVIKRTPEQQLAYEHRLLKRKMERNSLTLSDLGRRLLSAESIADLHLEGRMGKTQGDYKEPLDSVVEPTTVTAAVTEDQTK